MRVDAHLRAHRDERRAPSRAQLLQSYGLTEDALATLASSFARERGDDAVFAEEDSPTSDASSWD